MSAEGLTEPTMPPRLGAVQRIVDKLLRHTYCTFEEARTLDAFLAPLHGAKDPEGPLVHRGAHHGRTLHESSTLEKAFADAWEKDNLRESAPQPILCALLRSPEVPSRPLSGFDERPWYFGEPPTQRDAIVAATVIQWLGSNVGRCFLAEVLKAEGWAILQPGIAPLHERVQGGTSE
jgi:hypothetical protein